MKIAVAPSSPASYLLLAAVFSLSAGPSSHVLLVGAAFSVGPSPVQRQQQRYQQSLRLGATIHDAEATMEQQNSSGNDFGTAMPIMESEMDPYAAFGLTDPDELAMGVEITDLLKWIGTYVSIYTYMLVYTNLYV